MIYKNILKFDDYYKLLKSGMFWEFYPELTGIWEEDLDTMLSSISDEEMERCIPSFNNLYDDKGNEINPIPNDIKLVVQCRFYDEYEYIINKTSKELGLDIFVVRKWILVDDLIKIITQ